MVHISKSRERARIPICSVRLLRRSYLARALGQADDVLAAHFDIRQIGGRDQRFAMVAAVRDDARHRHPPPKSLERVCAQGRPATGFRRREPTGTRLCSCHASRGRSSHGSVQSASGNPRKPCRIPSRSAGGPLPPRDESCRFRRLPQTVTPASTPSETPWRSPRRWSSPGPECCAQSGFRARRARGSCRMVSF